MPGCRQILSYGGLDLDVLAHALLHRQRLADAIPHLGRAPSYQPSIHTQKVLRSVRHASVSLRLNDDPCSLPHADVMDGRRRVRVHLGSLSALPALVYFAPSVAATMQRMLGTMGPSDCSNEATAVDHSDVWDDEFLADSALERALPAGVTPAGPKDLFIGAANFAPTLTKIGVRHASGITPDAQLGFSPLDEAIVRAVERGKSTEVKRRLYSTILLLGGCARTPGLVEYLEWRLACCWGLASDSAEGIERVEVLRLPEGTDPENVIWRGAAMLPALESGRGLWIFQHDWEHRGTLAAREACAFAW